MSPGASKRMTPGPVTAPATSVEPRITRDTCRAMISSLPTPFWTLATEPSTKMPAAALIAASVNEDFVATMPRSHGGIEAASVRACTRAVSSARPVMRRPCALIASTCSVDASSAHTSTSGAAARRAAKRPPIAPQPTTQTRRVMRPAPIARSQQPLAGSTPEMPSPPTHCPSSQIGRAPASREQRERQRGGDAIEVTGELHPDVFAGELERGRCRRRRGGEERGGRR